MSSPARRLTRSSALRSRASKPVTNSSTSKMTEVTKQPDAVSEKGVLGKGKISFSFIKKRLQTSLVQYSDEDSAASEREDSEDRKEQSEAKMMQSAQKSSSLPPSVPKIAVDDPVKDIPVPHDSNKNMVPLVIKSQEQHSTPPKICTRFRKQLFNKSKSDGSPKKTCAAVISAGSYKSGAKNNDAVSSVQTSHDSERADMTEPSKSIDKLPNGRHGNVKYYENVGSSILKSAVYKASDEAKENHSSLTLYEDTDDIDIKPVFALPQTNEQSNDQMARRSNTDVERKEISSSSKEGLTKTLCKNAGIGSKRQPSEHGELKLYDDTNSVDIAPATEIVDTGKKREDLPGSSGSVLNDRKLSENEKETEKRDHADVQKVSNSETKSSPSPSSSSSSSSSSSDSENEDSDSASSSASSDCASGMGEHNKAECLERSKQSAMLDAASDKECVEQKLNEEPVVSFKLTVDLMQHVQSTTEAASPYSPSKPTDEDTEPRAGMDVTEKADTEIQEQKMLDNKSCSTSSASESSSSSGSSSSGSSSSSDSEDSESEMDSGNRNEEIQHGNDNSAHLVMEQPADMTDASVKHMSPAHVSPESSHSTLRDLPVGHTSDRTKHLHNRHRTVSDSASTENIRHDYVTSSGEVISDARTTYRDSTRSERVTEVTMADKTQHPHHYTIPPNAPSWNLVEITSTSNSGSFREKPPQLSDLGRAERTEIPRHDRHGASHDRAAQNEDYPEGRDRSHNRDREQSGRARDWGHDRYRDYARGRRNRDDEYEAKGSRDRDRERHYDDRSRRYRRSKSREWDGRSKERRSRSREREGQSHSRERVKRSRSREREHQSRSRERDRRSLSRDRKALSRSRDRIRRSRERERRSRSREHEAWTWHRGRDRRSRSRERRRSRDRYERDYRRRRKSSSREREDHRRIEDRRERHSSGHYRDDSRLHRELEKVQRSSTSTALAAELESIPLPTAVQESEMYLPAEPVPIPTIPHSYAQPKQACFEHPAGPIVPDEVPAVAAPCQQRNLIYPPTVEMDNVSDIESVDMDVTDSPNETKPSEEDKQKGDVHLIPVINQRSSSDEKAAARVAFSMKTVPKKSALFRQMPGVFDDSGPGGKRTQPGAAPGQVRQISEAGSSFSSGAVSAIPLPTIQISQPTTELSTAISGRDASRGTVFTQETQPQSEFNSKEVIISHAAGSTTDTQSDGSCFSQTTRTEEAGIQHTDEVGLQRSRSEVRKDENQAADTQQNDESSTPLTRRRSKRLRSLEEKKELPGAETTKQGRNSGMDDDESGGKLHSANDGQQMVSQSEVREQFASPDSKDGIAAKVRTPSPKPEKVKSRWRRWSELEASSTDAAPPPPPPPRKALESSKPSEVTNLASDATSVDDEEDGVPPPPPPPPVSSAPSLAVAAESITEDSSREKLEPQEMPSLPEFEQIIEHIYVSDRKKSKCRKEARRMVCDCVLPTKEEYLAGHKPCGDDCLNRMLFIECGSRCPCLDFCSNKRFQKRKYAKVEPFYAGVKGWGLKTKQKIEPGSFIMEYVGEVLDYREFRRRSKQYSRSSLKHFYFMALNADEVIDATQKGNISRFINHSCDPNCETQKWTVNGQLRIGFFAIRPLEPGEELTFDYQFESYGQAQKCYCGSENCRGYIGTTKKSPVKDSTNVSSKKEKRKIFNDVLLEEEINDMMELEGMRKRAHVLELARLMVRAESQEHRLALLKIIQDTKEPACLRLFLDYHGLSLLWSWMVDTTESSRELKVSLLKVLKQLPITNKTVLKESNIMSVVERWSSEISEARKDDAKDEISESSSSGRGTPVVGSKEVSQSAPTTPSYESIPHKKRKLFQHLQQQDEPSSSDGDTASESGKKDAASTKEDTDSQTGDPDSKESESEIDTTQTDVEKVSGDWNSPLDSEKTLPSVTDIASELISEWGNLKEVYKIPKICAQERKKTEQELDQRYGLDRHDLSAEKDRKRFSGGTNWSMGRDGKRRRLSSNKDGESKTIKTKKILLPTPPEALLSKHERRALFEAQVKAQDELVYQQQIHQMSQYPQGYQYDPNVPAQYPVDPNISSYSGNPTVPGYPSDPNMASYPDPNITFPAAQDSVYVDPGQAGTVNSVVSPQLIVQPDGTYIPAPQTVSASFQQPALGTTVPDATLQSVPFVEASQSSAETTVQQVLPGQSPAAGSQFGESTPTAVVYQTPSQPQYQAPVTPPFISQAVTATVTASHAAVSYVTTPAQQQAAQYVQTQPVQQVYYATPQGQVIVQQQPVVFQGQAQVVAVADAAQGPRDPREPPPPPPSPPPRARKRRLPPNWKTARDSEGKIYYYHAVTRQTQWDPPAWEGEQDDDMDLGTPTHDEPKSKKKTTTAAADTSTETAKRIKDHFRAKMSKLIVSYLNPYRRPDCKAGRITSTDDFKHLARKLTHTVLEKELKHCRHLEDLEVNENVKAKTKDYIKKYMSRFGQIYKKATTSP